MNTLEAIKKRVSVRAYQPEQISEEALETILKAGMQAPVASGGYASMHLTVVQDPVILKEIASAVNDLIFKMLGQKMDKDFGAPTMIIISAKPGKAPGVDSTNAGCIAENMAIAATDLGIGSIVWGGASVAIAQDPELRAKLQIPEGFQPALACSLGYSQKEEAPKDHTINVNRV